MKNYLDRHNCVKTELKMLTAYDNTLAGGPQGARSHIYYV